MRRNGRWKRKSARGKKERNTEVRREQIDTHFRGNI